MKQTWRIEKLQIFLASFFSKGKIDYYFLEIYKKENHELASELLARIDQI